MSLYNKEFYENRHKNTVNTAETILSIVRKIVPEIKSAVDFGCGVGTWLYVLEQNGATNICGVDGDWVKDDYLKIQKNQFIRHDLSKSTNPNIKNSFDLAMSLEVAEHLPASSAKDFVSLLTNSSDFILFSAAIPKQGGKGHINEQWPNYWISLFENQGYMPIDVIRKRIWKDESIAHWYRQNILMFVKKERMKDLEIEKSLDDHIPAEVYLLSFNKYVVAPRVKHGLHILFSAIKNQLFGSNTKNR